MKQQKTACTKAAQLAEITKGFFRRGQLKRGTRCLKIAEELFIKGEGDMRLAIANTYLYSISLFLDLHRFPTTKLLPLSLRREYVSQVNACAT